MSGTDTVFGTTVSDLQSGITVADGAPTGEKPEGTKKTTKKTTKK